MINHRKVKTPNLPIKFHSTHILKIKMDVLKILKYVLNYLSFPFLAQVKELKSLG